MVTTRTDTGRSATYYTPNPTYWSWRYFGDWDERGGYLHIGVGGDLTEAWRNWCKWNTRAMVNTVAGTGAYFRAASGIYGHGGYTTNSPVNFTLLGFRVVCAETGEWVDLGVMCNSLFDSYYYTRSSKPAIIPWTILYDSGADEDDRYWILRITHPDTSGGHVVCEVGLKADPWTADLVNGPLHFFTQDVPATYNMWFYSQRLGTDFSYPGLISSKSGFSDFSVGSVTVSAESQHTEYEPTNIYNHFLPFKCEMRSGFRGGENTYKNNIIEVDGTVWSSNIDVLTKTYVDDHVFITDIPDNGDFLVFDKQLPLSGFRWEIEMIRHGTHTGDSTPGYAWTGGAPFILNEYPSGAPDYDTANPRLTILQDASVVTGNPAAYRLVSTIERVASAADSTAVKVTNILYAEDGSVINGNPLGVVGGRYVYNFIEDTANPGYLLPFGIKIHDGIKIRRITWETYYNTWLIQPITADLDADFSSFNDLTNLLVGPYAGPAPPVKRSFFMHRTGITGGTAEDLDGIDPNDIEGAGVKLTEGSVVLVTEDTSDAHLFVAEEDPAAVESIPDVIIPDTNPGDWAFKRVPINENKVDQYSISGTGVTCDTDINHLLFPVFQNSSTGYIETPYFTIDEQGISKTGDSKAGTMTILSLQQFYKKRGFDG